MVHRSRLRGGRARRVLTFLALITLAACSGTDRPPREGVAPGARNVVIFVSDALRASSLRLHGYPIATTPHLDAFAREATVFSRHYAHYPATPGSISQLMTGRLMSPWLLDARPAVVEARQLPEDMMVLPSLLGRAGFRTGLVTTHQVFFENAPLLEHFDVPVVLDPPPGRAFADVDALTAPVEHFLESVARQHTPFFLYVHAMDTHSPYEGWTRPPPVDLPKAKRYGAYDARVQDIDQWFGRLLGLLERLDLAATTAVVFTSDHGEDHREEGRQLWNKHHGFTLRETQVHIPMVVRVPDDVRPGSVHEGATGHIDLAPTLLSLTLGPEALSGSRVDGVDLSRFWSEGHEQVDPDRPIPVYNDRYWGFFVGRRLVRFDPWGGHLAEFTFHPNELNYPRPVEVTPTLTEAGRRLVGMRRESLAEYLAFPPGGVRDRERVGVPNWIETDEEAAPTYAYDPNDGRWMARTWMQLECSPTETCPPLEVGMPWVAGRYRLHLRLVKKGLFAPYQHRLVLEVDGGAGWAEPLEVRPGESPRVEVGTHDIGDFLRLRLSRPAGGVALEGLEIERVGADVGQPLDLGEREEQLRALGYLE